MSGITLDKKISATTRPSTFGAPITEECAPTTYMKRIPQDIYHKWHDLVYSEGVLEMRETPTCVGIPYPGYLQDTEHRPRQLPKLMLT